MNDKQTKKEIITEYKNREFIGGVYAIRNTLSNRLLVGASTDLQGIRNRFEFSQKTDSCVDMKLQSDWKQFGGSQFCFEVLDELKKSETQTMDEFQADIAALKEIWLDELAGHVLY